MIEVIQSDRDAAADYLQANGDAFTAHMRDGAEDDTAVVQTFAAHRQQAEDAMRERCAAIAKIVAEKTVGIEGYLIATDIEDYIRATQARPAEQRG